MSRNKVNLDINPDKLRSLVAGKETFSAFAEKFGVTRQAVNNWLTEGRMPPRAIVELIRDLDATSEDIEELLAPQTEKAKKRRKWVITIVEPEDNKK